MVRPLGLKSQKMGQQRVIHCESEVILCAGAFNTPKLLMLSGVGDADELRKHHIPVVADVSEVGRNLQNHPGLDLQYASNYEDSLTSQLGMFGQVNLAVNWLLRKKGLGASNFFETGAFLRTRDDVTFPNVQFEFLPLTRQLKNGKLVPIPGFQFWMDLSRPESRGVVRLRSANPAEPPLIIFNHMESRQDVKDMIDSIRLARKLVHQPAWDKYRKEELTPGADVVSDSELEAFIRKQTASSYHPSSTCRMGSDAKAVVDGEGRVQAVPRLRIVDASIMPKVVTANLTAPTMMMAEKISDRILGKPPLAPSTVAY